MTSTQVFAFIILPIVVAGLGWGVALWNDRTVHRHHER